MRRWWPALLGGLMALVIPPRWQWPVVALLFATAVWQIVMEN